MQFSTCLPMFISLATPTQWVTNFQKNNKYAKTDTTPI